VASLLDLLDDPRVFGPWFPDPATWAAWRAFLAALFGLEMDAGERELFKRCTGREEPPGAPLCEGWLIVGRRGGKSFILSLIAVFLAAFKDWRPYLSPGERAVVMLVAADKKQARVLLGYIRALIQNVHMLRPLIERETSEAIDLTNGVSIEVFTCSYRTIRGRTVVAALLDEVSFWRSDDSASPDHEILAAIRPAMATVPGAVLLAASSPYARRGVLYQAHRDHFGKDGPILVWQAPTRTMNPSVPKRIIAEAYERDPSSAAAEFGAQFRSDIEAFIDRIAVEAVVIAKRLELPPIEGESYVAFCDPSGGRQDSMTLAIAHGVGREVAVLDAVREVRPPFSPEAVVAEFEELLRSYGLATVRGDRYAGEWPREVFEKNGIAYLTAGKPKSAIYVDALPGINSGKVELLDLPRLINQICSLERRTARGGRDSIDHPPGGHDDIANAALGAIWLVRERRPAEPRIRVLGDDDTLPPGHWRPVFGPGGGVWR
jgi:hypothetical protein